MDKGKRDNYKVVLRKIHSHVRLVDRDAPIQMFDETHQWVLQQVMQQQALLRAFSIFRAQMDMVERQIRKNKIHYEHAWIINTNACIRLLWKLDRKQFTSLHRRYIRSDIDNPLIDQLIEERRKTQQFMDKYLTIKRKK